ncbi:alpha/beta hydrolase [Actinokineospora inagensis]|uniref:alpha/beta hydrolase n=1 Tax=Actinokineospora inagensis TaxID=103730 RepID=UPI0003FA0F74|nr:alpha/beta hydrolase [Actinokineospora inagensis]
MPLHPQVAAMRERRVAQDTPPLYTLSLEQARADDLASIQAAGGTPEPVGSVVDLSYPGPDGEVPLRIYRPEAEGPLPVLFYFFGGGWTLGTIDTADAICRRLANAVGCLVVGVGYRLAPEHRFPAALEDCYGAVEWFAANGASYGADVTRIAVGGDSAGGNLAAVISLMARDRQGPALKCQLLVYPNTDYTASTGSMAENTDSAFFNNRSVAWYWSHYLGDAPTEGLDPRVSPLRATDHTGLPSALVITAEYDPLRDQGEAYAAKLAAAGVPVELSRYDGMIHGFFAMAGDLDDGARAQEEAAAYLRKFL